MDLNLKFFKSFFNSSLNKNVIKIKYIRYEIIKYIFFERLLSKLIFNRSTNTCGIKEYIK